MAKTYVPTAAGFGPAIGSGGPTFEKTTDDKAGFGGVGPPSNRTILPLFLYDSSAASGATSSCRIPLDCEILAIDGRCESGSTPTFVLSVTLGSFTSSARALDGTLVTSLTPLEKSVLKAGDTLTVTFGAASGTIVDAQVVVYVQVIGAAPNA